MKPINVPAQGKDTSCAKKPLPLVVRMTRAENNALGASKLLEEARFHLREMRNLLHSKLLLSLFGECNDNPKCPYFADIQAWLESRDELEAWLFGEEEHEPRAEQAPLIKPADCPLCDGSGLYFENAGRDVHAKECERCNGTGKISE